MATATDGKLIYVGGLGNGFNAQSAPPLKAKLDAIQSGLSPIPGLKNKNAVWTRPDIVVEIELRNWTEDGQLRHPSFKRVQDDRLGEEYFSWTRSDAPPFWKCYEIVCDGCNIGC